MRGSTRRFRMAGLLLWPGAALVLGALSPTPQPARAVAQIAAHLAAAPPEGALEEGVPPSEDRPAPTDAASNDAADRRGGRCPAEMVAIEDFCIDRWEAHLVHAGAEVHPYYERPEAGVRYEARSAPNVHPQGYVSRGDAEAACRHAEKRLCTFEEWRRACRGVEGHVQPYGGEERVEGRCNQGVPHLMGQLHGRDPRAWTQSDLDDPRLLRDTDALARTEAHERCVSSDGVYDMVGNLHEWIAGEVTLSFMHRLAADRVYRRSQPWRIGNGIFVGGFFSTRGELGRGCLFTTVAHRPRYHDYSTGFRCCRDAD